jgi:hypothetical protein
MASDKPPKSPIHYVQRLLEDDYVQEQLREAAIGLRAAYGRVSRKRVAAAEDKKLYGNLQQATTSIRKALVALQRPKPKPQHRIRKVALAVVVVGGGALLIGTRGRKNNPPAGTSEGGATDAVGSNGAPGRGPDEETATGASEA